MDLQLTFEAGEIRGDGTDEAGRFFVRGHYDSSSMKCSWTKTYDGAHDVLYRGYREGKGIWGGWEILQLLYRNDHGNFHIWPLQSDAETAESESAKMEEAVNAVATVINVP